LASQTRDATMKITQLTAGEAVGIVIEDGMVVDEDDGDREGEEAHAEHTQVYVGPA
jgi:hypothetical protein